MRVMQAGLVISIIIFLLFGVFLLFVTGLCACSPVRPYYETSTAIVLTNNYVDTAISNTQIALTLTATASNQLVSVEETARAKATIFAMTKQLVRCGWATAGAPLGCSMLQLVSRLEK